MLATMRASFILVLFFLGCSRHQRPREVATETAVSISMEQSHQLVFENSYVRAFMTVVPGHSRNRVHLHASDYVSVVVTNGSIANFLPNTPPIESEVESGLVTFSTRGFVHAIGNRGELPFRVQAIEIKKQSARIVCGSKSLFRQNAVTLGGQLNTPCVNSEVAGRVLFETDVLRASMILSDAYSTFTVEAGEHLLVGLTGSQLHRSRQVDELLPGSVLWISATDGEIVRVGAIPATMVLLSFKY